MFYSRKVAFKKFIKTKTLNKKRIAIIIVNRIRFFLNILIKTPKVSDRESSIKYGIIYSIYEELIKV